MKQVVIGVAGHVDHGKTALVKALTGMDTDRLAEEKTRGLTIEPGFAWINLEGEIQAGMVDLPGHEKFLGNLLTGVGGIDLAILTVAVDEGVMPQTREHLEILSLLGISVGLVVITKLDLAEPGDLELVKEELAALVAGTFLEGAPMVSVSAKTGAGIPALKKLLAQLAAGTPPRNLCAPFALPIDRVFTAEGFGTVVTGTLTAGTLAPGGEAALYPSGKAVRVRGLQAYGKPVERALAGQRVAVNLAGISREEVRRGDLLAAPGSMTCSDLVDVRLRLLPGSGRTLSAGARLHFYCGARAVCCRAALLGQSALHPGESCCAQLRLEEPLAVQAGGRFVVRFYSPLETIGGGVILDPCPARHRPSDPDVLAALAVLESGSDSQRVLQALEAAAFPTWEDAVESSGLPQERARAALAALLARGEAAEYFPGRYLGWRALDALRVRLHLLLSAYHRGNPLLAGIPREAARKQLCGGLEPAVADGLLALFCTEGLLQMRKDRLLLAGFSPCYNVRQRRIREQVEAIYRRAWLAPPATEAVRAAFSGEREPFRQVLEALLEEGELVLVEPQLLFARQACADALAELRRHVAPGEPFTLGQFRDWAGTTRKYALALLDYWDRCKVSKRIGDVRMLEK